MQRKVSREGKNGQDEGGASISGSKSCSTNQVRDDRKSPIIVSYGECKVNLQGAVGCPWQSGLELSMAL